MGAAQFVPAEHAEFLGIPYAPKVLFDGEDLRCLVLSVEAGARMSPHAADELAVYVLQGEGSFTAGEEVFPLSPGRLVHCPAGVLHGLTASSRLVLLLLLGRRREGK
ncbi:MAG: cupin domain-containing protein [Thermaerobacter sp.]|nr:cupin domain-containing protein [Thermaerobacter sp.]